MENGEWDELAVSGRWDSWLCLEDGIASSAGLLHLSLSGGITASCLVGGTESSTGGWDS
jgi:hypothetical protein